MAPATAGTTPEGLSRDRDPAGSADRRGEPLHVYGDSGGSAGNTGSTPATPRLSEPDRRWLGSSPTGDAPRGFPPLYRKR